MYCHQSLRKQLAAKAILAVFVILAAKQKLCQVLPNVGSVAAWQVSEHAAAENACAQGGDSLRRAALAGRACHQVRPPGFLPGDCCRSQGEAFLQHEQLYTTEWPTPMQCYSFQQKMNMTGNNNACIGIVYTYTI